MEIAAVSVEPEHTVSVGDKHLKNKKKISGDNDRGELNSQRFRTADGIRRKFRLGLR